MRYFRHFLGVFIGVLLLGTVLPGVAIGQSPGSAITPAQARQVLDVLNDPRRRQEFTATLDAIAKSLPATPVPQPSPATPTPPVQTPPLQTPPLQTPALQTPAIGAEPVTAALSIPLKPDSLGAELLTRASDFLSRLGDQTRRVVGAMSAVPTFWHWVTMMLTDPLGQSLLLDTAWRLAVTIGAGLATEWILRLALRRPFAMVLARSRPPGGPIAAPETRGNTPDAMELAELAEVELPAPVLRRRRFRVLEPLKRLSRAALHLGCDLLPLLGFLVTAHLIAGSQIGAIYMIRLVLLAVTDAYAASRLAIAVAACVFSPQDARRRLLPVEDATAAAGLFWIRWITLIGIIGYAVAEVGLLLGMSTLTHDAMLKTGVLIIYLMLIFLILRYRHPVADFIRAPPNRPNPGGWPERGIWVANGMMQLLRRWLARVWHIAASVYLLALWLVWAVDIPSGFSQVLHFFILSIIVLVVAQIARAVLQGMLDRTIEPDAPVNRRSPGRADRLRIYYPMLTLLLRVCLFLAVCLTLGQIYGIGIFDWLTTAALGQRVMSAAVSIALTLTAGVVIWETANAAIQRHLLKLQKEAQTAKSARLRTLLPMLRTALLGTILVVIAMMALSEIGVNIAPLVAGAGVLGIAIGFGSQKLVQDVITGLFLLLENTMQVGDMVTLGGLTGSVEHLSIRTIQLRAEDGSVYVIPFSAVTTVTNMTRDFSQAVLEVQVAYKDDYDHVVRVLRQIVIEMRAEPRWESDIRDDLEVLGLARFADSSVVIKCRIRCGPFARWSVGREFNRRMKLAFDENGIEIPFPSQKMIFEPQTAQKAPQIVPQILPQILPQAAPPTP